MSCVATFAIFPLDKDNTESLSPYVARVIKIVEQSGLPYQLGAMGTSLEGDYEQVMEVIQRCHNELRKDCERVYLTIAVDSKTGDSGRIETKVRNVEELL